MPKIKNETDSAWNAARNLLVIEQYEKITSLARGVCNVVPLKGIALLTTLYADTLEREVGDIDLLVFPRERLMEFVDKLRREGYQMQFDFLLDEATAFAKQKVALRSTTGITTDIDLHLQFITKKFFRASAEPFNSDALARCRPTAENRYEMDPVDQWLFLAQHCCFHLYSSMKWLRDLDLLLRAMTPEQHELLAERAVKYGFCRVVTVTMDVLRRRMPDAEGLPVIKLPHASGPACRFARRFVERRRPKWLANFVERFWELSFIDRGGARCSAYMRMLFPSISLMHNIYRSSSTAALEAMYPVHLLITALGMALYRLVQLRYQIV